MKIILLGHKRRMGKDTTALMLKDILEKKGVNVFTFAFADTLKVIACNVLNISIEELDERKNTEGDDTRDFLIRLATGMRENIGADVFKKALLRKLIGVPDDAVAIITDFRLKNEFIEGSYTVNVTGRNVALFDTHTEVDLDDWDFDHTIINDATYHELESKVEDLAEVLIEKM